MEFKMLRGKYIHKSFIMLLVELSPIFFSEEEISLVYVLTDYFKNSLETGLYRNPVMEL